MSLFHKFLCVRFEVPHASDIIWYLLSLSDWLPSLWQSLGRYLLSLSDWLPHYVNLWVGTCFPLFWLASLTMTVSGSSHVAATGKISFTKATSERPLDWLNTCYPQCQRALCPLKFVPSPGHGRTLSICVMFSLLTLAQAWEAEWKVDSKPEARDQTGDNCNQTGSGCGDEKLFKELVWQDLQIYCECRVWERVENECQKLKYFQFYPSPPFFLSFYFPFHLLGFTLDSLRFCLHCLGVFIH